ncbi:MAG: proton-conducting transporter membrane subunit, partial [bacterium]
LLHAVNHSFTKGMLFLVAGNILAAYRTKSVIQVQGVTRVLPVSGVLWIMGFLAITGTPPFGPFLSEFTILKAALDQGRVAVAASYLIFLSVIFMGMAATFLRTARGLPRPDRVLPRRAESWLTVLPPMALGALVFLLGVYIPPSLNRVLHDAARILGGS